MQTIGLFFAAFFGTFLAAVLLLLARQWLFCSRHAAKVKVLILPGQEETLEYTLRALRYLQKTGRLNIQSIQHQPQHDLPGLQS